MKPPVGVGNHLARLFVLLELRTDSFEGIQKLDALDAAYNALCLVMNLLMGSAQRNEELQVICTREYQRLKSIFWYIGALGRFGST